MQLGLRWLVLVSVFTVLILAETGYFLSDFPKIDVYGNEFLQEKEGLLYYKELPFTGVAIERFPNQSIYRSTEYKDGTKHGITKVFGYTGAMKYRWNYVNGLKDGDQYGWYLEGPRKFIQSYSAGLLHGVSTEWFIGGSLFRERHFFQGVESSSKVHYATGELHTNYVKRDGAIYGLKAGELCMDFPKEGEIR